MFSCENKVDVVGPIPTRPTFWYEFDLCYQKEGDLNNSMDAEPTEQDIKTELDLKFSSRTEADFKHPDINEDAIFFDEKAGIAMVLDGMGGIAGGKQASSLARDFIRDNLYGMGDDIEQAKQHMENVVREASRTLKAENDAGETTAVVVKIVKSGSGMVAIIASVGDSRAYIFRAGQLRQVTVDDSIIPKRLRQKFDATDGSDLDIKTEYGLFSRRNLVTQGLGSKSDPEVHLYQEKLKKADKVILTSDGVHDNLTTSEISEIAGSTGEVAEELVNSAFARSRDNLLRSKHDDASAIVVEVG